MELDRLHYTRSLTDVCEAYPAFEPPQARTVAEGAAKSLVIKQTGAPSGPWSAAETPYMVEPMNKLASRLHEAVVFVGPARTGKTAALLLGWMAHALVNDPGDMLFIQMTQDKAREFSKTDVSKAINHSPDITAMLSLAASDRNTHDVMFKNGMWLRIAWPTVSNVSGSTYRYGAVTDLDRIPNAEDIDGEGPLFQLLLKRVTTFLSRGMVLAESSPGIDLRDSNWRPATPHEAPPVTGILGIYNRSDRHRWYWQCPDCREHFEAAPGLNLFALPSEEEILDRVRTASLTEMAKQYGRRIVCPHCGVEIQAKHKTALNASGIWLADEQQINADRVISGPPASSKIAGYWLGGVAATYQSWESLVERYLQGMRDYALTGSENTLKTTTNTDQGLPYLSRHLKESQNRTSSPEQRADTSMKRHIVPDWTRFLVASVDVQGGSMSRFEVQVHAVGEFMEQAVVDRYAIKDSRREGLGTEFAPIDPAAHAEDWDVITDKVVRATYRTNVEGRELQVLLTVVDSGGEDGVTDRAYAWYRRLRREGLNGRVMLYKGASEPKAPVIKESWVGRRNAQEAGDIPLYLCNPNLLSDAVSTGLKRESPGPGFIHFPSWLPKAFYDELGAEVRGENGVWKKVRRRNEAFDLCRMIRGGLLRLGVDKITDWSQAPRWAKPLDDGNSGVMSREDRRALQDNVRVASSAQPADLSERPARRRSVSSYLS